MGIKKFNSNISCFFYFKCPLGVEMLNSNISGEMAQLMILNQEKYVPAVKNDGAFKVIEPIFF